jgi:hypothetical protein
MRRSALLIVPVLTAMLAASVGAASRSVSVRWQPSTTPGVVGYRVYVRQLTDATFAPPIEVGLPTPANDGTMSATLPGWDDGVDWVFALSAVGTGSDESGLSNPITLGGTGTGSTITTTSTTTSTTAPVPCGDDDECDDGSACTADDRCASGFCAWDSVVCPVGEPCNPGRCDPGAGCVLEPAPPGTPCDLGDPCLPGLCSEEGCTATLARLDGGVLSVSRFVIRNRKHGQRLVARASFGGGALDPTASGFSFDVSAADGKVLWAASVPPEAFAKPKRRGRRLRHRMVRRLARSAAPDVRRLVILVDDAGVADVRLVAVTDSLGRSRGEQALRWAVRSGDQCVSDPGLVCEDRDSRTTCS